MHPHAYYVLAACENSFIRAKLYRHAGGVKQASHLLKYDSTLGKFDAEVK
jgi:hypothetical protein